MENKEILMVVDTVSSEKNVDKAVIFEAIEAALAAARRKIAGEGAEYRVAIDRHTGEYETFQVWHVVAEDDEDFDPGHHLTPAEASKRRPGAVVGDVIEEPVEPVAFGRIAAQLAKQVIVQKVREAERDRVLAIYGDRLGEMMTGQVKRVERGNAVIDLGENAEVLLPRDKSLPRENMRIGDRVSFVLESVNPEPRGPQLIGTRTAPKLLVELFRREVPEVKEGAVEIVGAARDPGVRAKIAVVSHEPRIDPIGACVGMHGTRVQSVSNELAGERVDIILADDNPAQFVINALSPAQVAAITVDEDSHSMDVAIDEEQLSLAIGRGGQNVRLASQLTGWELNMMTEEEAQAKGAQEAEQLSAAFVEALDVDPVVADILVQEGFSTVEEIAYVPESELLCIDEFDEELVGELRGRAQDVMLTKAIAEEEQIEGAEPGQDLLDLPGMDTRAAFKLAAKGVISADDLAELAVDELTEITDLSADVAGELIMAARASWFAEADD